jgi:hypothetical protein
MQTFIPFDDHAASARVLDRQRLGKQRVETLQILNTLTSGNKGWSNHPAVKMWRGHESALVQYGLAVCDEWVARGYRDTCRDKIAAFDGIGNAEAPAWFGDPAIHASHRGVLLHKNNDYYAQHGWDDAPVESVIWPVE